MQRLCYLLLFILAFSSNAQAAAVYTDKIEEGSLALLPYMSWLPDREKTPEYSAASSKDNEAKYIPLGEGFSARDTGAGWLKLKLQKNTILSNLSGAEKEPLFLNTSSLPPGKASLFSPGELGQSSWFTSIKSYQSIQLSEPSLTGDTYYIHLEETPGLWFKPSLYRGEKSSPVLPPELLLPGLLLACLLACLLRALKDRALWPVWAAAILGCALVMLLSDIPLSSSLLGYADLPALLAPGIILIVFPHLGRLILNTREYSLGWDTCLRTLSLIGVVACLAPLLPGYGWLSRLYPLWALCLLPILPVAGSAMTQKIPGAFAFFSACFMPFLGAFLSLVALSYPDMPLMANYGSLWGIAVGGIALALTHIPKEEIDKEEQETDNLELKLQGLDQKLEPEKIFDGLELTDASNSFSTDFFDSFDPMDSRKETKETLQKDITLEEYKVADDASDPLQLETPEQEDETLELQAESIINDREDESRQTANKLPATGDISLSNELPGQDVSFSADQSSYSPTKVEINKEELGVKVFGPTSFGEFIDQTEEITSVETSDETSVETSDNDENDENNKTLALADIAFTKASSPDETEKDIQKSGEVCEASKKADSGTKEADAEVKKHSEELTFIGNKDFQEAEDFDLKAQVEEKIDAALALATQMSSGNSPTKLIQLSDDTFNLDFDPLADLDQSSANFKIARSEEKQALEIDSANGDEATNKALSTATAQLDQPNIEEEDDETEVPKTLSAFDEMLKDMNIEQGSAQKNQFEDTGSERLLDFSSEGYSPRAKEDFFVQKAYEKHKLSSENLDYIDSAINAMTQDTPEASNALFEKAAEEKHEIKKHGKSDNAETDAKNKKSIIITEMTTSNKKLLSNYLASQELICLDAGRMEDSFALFKKHRSPLFIFDGDSLEEKIIKSIAEIKGQSKDGENISFLLLAGSIEQAERLMTQGINHFILKPFEKHELIAAAKKAAPELFPEQNKNIQKAESAGADIILPTKVKSLYHAVDLDQEIAIDYNKECFEDKSMYAAERFKDPHQLDMSEVEDESNERSSSKASEDQARKSPQIKKESKNDESEIAQIKTEENAKADTENDEAPIIISASKVFGFSSSQKKAPEPSISLASLDAHSIKKDSTARSNQVRNATLTKEDKKAEEELKAEQKTASDISALADIMKPSRKGKATESSRLVNNLTAEDIYTVPAKEIEQKSKEQKDEAADKEHIEPEQKTSDKSDSLLDYIITEDDSPAAENESETAQEKSPDDYEIFQMDTDYDKAHPTKDPHDLSDLIGKDDSDPEDESEGEPEDESSMSNDDMSNDDTGHTPLPGLENESINTAMLPLVPGFILTIEDTMIDAQKGLDDGQMPFVQEAVNSLADRAETFGMEKLNKIAKCVERAANADDQEAVTNLLEDLLTVAKRYKESLQKVYEDFIDETRVPRLK